MKNKIIVISVLFVVIIVFVAIIILKKNKTEYYKTIDHYEWVTYHKGISVLVASYKNDRGVGELTSLKNENYLIQMAWASTAKRNLIASYIQIGDSIVKKENNDTIYVIRNNTSKVFILDKNCKIPE